MRHRLSGLIITMAVLPKTELKLHDAIVCTS